MLDFYKKIESGSNPVILTNTYYFNKSISSFLFTFFLRYDAIFEDFRAKTDIKVAKA